MSTNSPFNTHGFLLSLGEDMEPMTQRAAKDLIARTRRTKSWPKKKKTPAHLPQPYSYYYGIFYHTVSLTSAADNLRKISVLMRSFPNKRTYEKNDITRSAWIKYHYANYVSTVVSLFDISLIVTNYVFRLGIPERKCTSDIILQNGWIKGTKVAEALLALEQVAQSFKAPRNLHLHRGQLPDIDELAELEIISHIQLHSEPIVDSKTMNQLYSLATRSILAELDDVSERSRAAVTQLLDALLPYYQTEKRHLLAGADR